MDRYASGIDHVPEKHLKMAAGMYSRHKDNDALNSDAYGAVRHHFKNELGYSDEEAGKIADHAEVSHIYSMSKDSNSDGAKTNMESIEEQSSTSAADTIKPKGKAATMNAVMDLIKVMPNEDLNGFNQMMAQYGADKDWGVPSGASGKNASTIQTKPSNALAMEEDLDVIFGEENELSEEFKAKASTLFEAAVAARLTVENAKLEEEFEQKLQEEIEVFSEEITSKLDAYLNEVVDTWMKENEVAIESALQTEATKEFIEGMKNLFSEHYIEIPEEKVDVLEATAEKVAMLESKLDEVLVENNEMRETITGFAIEKLAEEISSDLALTQKEKFYNIVEGLEFDGDLDNFRTKLETVKAGFFKESSEPQKSSNILEEEFDGGEESETTVSVDPSVARYVDAIKRTVKK